MNNLFVNEPFIFLCTSILMLYYESAVLPVGVKGSR